MSPVEMQEEYERLGDAFWFTEAGHKLMLQGGARVARRMGYPKTAETMEADAQ